MLNTILTFVQETKEWQGLGFNALTAGFCFILVEAAMLLWGRKRQLQTLWKPDMTTMSDVAGMSMTKEFFVFSFYFISFNYGLFLKSIALMTALPIGIMDALIVIRLLQLKRLVWWEYGAGLAGLSLVAVAFFSHWEVEVFGLISTILVFPLAAQPLEMWKRQSAAGLNPRVPMTNLISASVWIFYSLMIGSWIIVGFSSLYVVIYASTLFLWWKFTPRKS